MSDDLDVIARRWSTYGGMGNDRSAADYSDAGCRILAEHGFRDANALLAALRERDQQITAVLGIAAKAAATPHRNDPFCVGVDIADDLLAVLGDSRG